MKKYLFLIALFTSGCSTIKFKYPSDISDMCYGERNSARECIESVDGNPLKIKKGVTLTLRPGEIKIGEFWAFKLDPSENFWTLGYYVPNSTIVIACKPNTMDEVSPSIVKHEHGHWWVYTNGREEGDPHNGRYTPCFIYWNATRYLSYPRNLSYKDVKENLKTISKNLKSGQVFSARFYNEKNQLVYADFIVQ